MEKTYITADDLLLDSIKLAEQIYTRGCRPHFIIGVWRVAQAVDAVMRQAHQQGISPVVPAMITPALVFAMLWVWL